MREPGTLPEGEPDVEAGGGPGHHASEPLPRVLFLTQVLPYPLDSGPKVRAYHVLRWLSRRAEVHLATFVREDDPAEAVDHLRGICAAVHTVPMVRSRAADAGHLARSILGGTSFIVSRDRVEEMRAVLDRAHAATRFDAVHADQLWMAQYALDLDVPLRVLDEHNAVYRIFERLALGEPSPVRRWVLRREAARLARYEAAQAEAFDRLLFVSAEDLAAVASVCSDDQRRLLKARSLVLPICVDVDGYETVDVRPDARRVTMLGTMYWPPNVEGVLWMAEKVWPRVLEAAPAAVFTVIGKRPPEDVRALSARLGPSVEVRGYVADVRPLLQETAAFVVPLLSGGGMRVKILDAWAWMLPVVSTTIGAEGIQARPGEEIEVADDPQRFADAVIGLLGDPRRRADLAAAGRRAVEQRYDAATVYDRLAEVYGGLEACRRAQA